MLIGSLCGILLVGQAAPAVTPGVKRTPVVRTDAKPTPSRTLQQAISANSSLKQFRQFAAKGDIARTYAGHGPYTIFAPTDQAFEKLPKQVLAALNRSDVARYQMPRHVVRGKIEPRAWKATRAVRSGSGDMLLLTESKGKLYVHGSRASANVIRTSNGLIYLVDDVLLKPMRPIATGFAGGGGAGRRRSNTVIPK